VNSTGLPVDFLLFEYSTTNSSELQWTPLESTGVHWKSTGTKVQWKMVESSGLPLEVHWKSTGLLELNLMNLLGL